MIAKLFTITIIVFVFIPIFNCKVSESTIHNEVILAMQTKCISFCENGKRESKGLEPLVNGCGPNGEPEFIRDKFDDELTACCNDHDVCYENCTQTKEECDNTFHRCIHSKRKQSFFEIIETMFTEVMEGEIDEGNWMYELVKMFGCPSYEWSQKRACNCLQNNDHSD